jgi:hypothetical protein
VNVIVQIVIVVVVILCMVGCNRLECNVFAYIVVRHGIQISQVDFLGVDSWKGVVS